MTNSSTVYEKITDQFIAALEEGQIPWRKPWAGGDSAPKNLVSKKEYRGVNVLILGFFSPYASPYWLTFAQAKKLGGSVKKGERSTEIIFWRWLEVKDKEDETKIKKIPMVRLYNVFNLEQTEGIEDPDKDKEQKIFDPIKAADAICDGYENAPEIQHRGASAHYTMKSDIITLPEPELFHSEEDYYSTLFHEYTHSTGHKDRLNREGVENFDHFGSEQYANEELIAEIGSAFLGAEAGIRNMKVIDNEKAYIQNWIKRLKNDKKAIIYSAAQAQRAADLILGRDPLAKKEKEEIEKDEANDAAQEVAERAVFVSAK